MNIFPESSLFQQSAHNLVDWCRTKVAQKKDRKTTARRKANRIARKQRKIKGK